MENRTGRRICLLLGAAVALVLAPASAVAEAPPLTGSITAVDTAFKNPATGQNKVVIAPGGTVEFSYPSGSTTHNVNFTGAAPTACAQASGANSGAVPPLPAVPTGPGWSGSCSFDSEGTYGFVCQLHGGMKGSVVVSATVPPEEPGSPGSGSGGSGGGSTGAGGGGSGGGAEGAAASQLVLARAQTGTVVRGSVRIARADSRLRVDLLASRSALGGRGAEKVGAGFYKKVVGAGKRSFAVRLAGAGITALADAGRLALTVRVTVDPASGADFTASKPVTLKPPPREQN